MFMEVSPGRVTKEPFLCATLVSITKGSLGSNPSSAFEEGSCAPDVDKASNMLGESHCPGWYFRLADPCREPGLRVQDTCSWEGLKACNISYENKTSVFVMVLLKKFNSPVLKAFPPFPNAQSQLLVPLPISRTRIYWLLCP